MDIPVELEDRGSLVESSRRVLGLVGPISDVVLDVRWVGENVLRVEVWEYYLWHHEFAAIDGERQVEVYSGLTPDGLSVLLSQAWSARVPLILEPRYLPTIRDLYRWAGDIAAEGDEGLRARLLSPHSIRPVKDRFDITIDDYGNELALDENGDE